MRIISLKEFLNQNPTESVVVEVSCLEEAKQIKKTESLFGLILSQPSPTTTISFEPTKCSCLEKLYEIKINISEGKTFIRTKHTKVKYFCLNGRQVVAKSFEKKISESWQGFFLETLAQVFSPEA